MREELSELTDEYWAADERWGDKLEAFLSRTILAEVHRPQSPLWEMQTAAR